MQETQGDLWTTVKNPDAICITTNAIVNDKGLAVMGRGVALEAAERFPWLRRELAHNLRRFGNQVYAFNVREFTEQELWVGPGTFEYLATLPVKTDWRLPAEFPLIEKSIRQLVFLTNALGWERVVLSRPGCGNGGLLWRDVRPIIEKHLDDRFIVVEKNP